ncbi:hypothetical protein SVIO_106760 [Streptomyces violaceusniger]|uniref:Uncharacterized protein n=1 Tax=Streptomyces violaceusniger TaxID=68280 RepID=A0A4D4LPR0_STRVO|nr:hypothetical protein SVIO_106760 [Streptomyces violaceusniger]
MRSTGVPTVAEQRLRQGAADEGRRSWHFGMPDSVAGAAGGAGGGLAAAPMGVLHGAVLGTARRGPRYCTAWSSTGTAPTGTADQTEAATGLPPVVASDLSGIANG